MDKSGIVELSEFAEELYKIRDTFKALDFACSEMEQNFPLALAVPTERLMALCETLHEIIEKEEGAGEDERENSN